jgi:hypothetical protein
MVLCPGENLEWVYLVLEVTRTSLLAYEFKMFLGFGKLEQVEQVESQMFWLATIEVSRVKMFLLKGSKWFYILVNSSDLDDFEILLSVGDPWVTFTWVEDGGSNSKTRICKKPELVVFQPGRIIEFPWDPNKWTLRVKNGLKVIPFFGYSAKRRCWRNTSHRL